ncbi:MAG: YkgJ family cysteine cluster protein [Desulfobacterales bacterium]|nr:YkgJ family cysteine cluster protein [Desulfobacterales bacterium]
MENNDQNHCRRCGTCCEKGGPTLHRDDLPLVEKGTIPLKDLYTIRKGEMVMDPAHEEPIPATEELVKIRGRGGEWRCRYLEEKGCVCQIYDHRPEECRAQKCWDTTEIEVVYPKDRISREDLLSGVSGLWELVQEHEQRCSYLQFEALARRIDTVDADDAGSLVTEMIAYDGHLRELVCGQGKMDPEILNFLFGRPMTETIHGFGLAVEKDGDRIILKPASSGQPVP